MSRPTTEERIRALASELEPVRPIPPLAAIVAAASALALAAVALEWLFGGLGLVVRRDGAWSQLSYLAALVGIALVAFGALGAALASAVPGRDSARRMGDALAAAGVALALAGAVWGVAHGGADATPQQLEASLHCGVRSVALGLASTLVAFAFMARAAPRRLGVAAALALAGGVGLGALIVHLTCPSGSVVHQLLGHTLAPVAAALVLALPAAALLRRLSARAR